MSGASAQPRPTGALWAPRTAHDAAPGPQRNAPDNPALPPLPAAPVAASGAPAESTPQRGGASHSSGRSRTSSAPRLAAGRVQREHHRRPSLHHREARPTSVQTQRASENARAGEARRKDVGFERWLRLSFELRGFTRRACSSPRGRRLPRGWITAAFESRGPIPKRSLPAIAARPRPVRRNEGLSLIFLFLAPD